MSAKHTPGPWQCYADVPSADPNWHIVTNASRQRVLANVHIEPGNEMDAANARLIAAAPDLLAALEALRVEYGPQTGRMAIGSKRRDLWMAARDAIDKATGAA